MSAVLNSAYDGDRNILRYGRESGVNFDGIETVSYITLGHELGHASRDHEGRTDMSSNPVTGIPQDEHHATDFENYLRATFGHPLRRTYGGRDLYGSNRLSPTKFSSERIDVRDTFYTAGAVPMMRRVFIHYLSQTSSVVKGKPIPSKVNY